MSQKIHAFRAYLALKTASPDDAVEPTETWVSRRRELYKEVRGHLLPFAEAGDPYFQYALAEVLSLELSLQPDAPAWQYDETMAQISSWWETAAAQGHVDAVEHLIGLGIGAEAERLRALGEEMETKGLAGTEDFLTRLTLRAYGVVLPPLPMRDDLKLADTLEIGGARSTPAAIERQ